MEHRRIRDTGRWAPSKMIGSDSLAGMTAPSQDDPEKAQAHPKTIAAYQERLETVRARS